MKHYYAEPSTFNIHDPEHDVPMIAPFLIPEGMQQHWDKELKCYVLMEKRMLQTKNRKFVTKAYD